MPIVERNNQARQKAQALWEKRKRQGELAVSEKTKQDQLELAKIARLKALRLAKEAADKEAALLAAPVPRKKRG